MEALLLNTCKVDPTLPAKIKDNGIESVEDLAECEIADLVADLSIDNELAEKIVSAAKDAVLFDKRKALVQGTWQAVADTLAAEGKVDFCYR